MTGKEKLMVGIKLGVIITVGSIVLGRVCKSGIELYRRKRAEEGVIFVEESE